MSDAGNFARTLIAAVQGGARAEFEKWSEADRQLVFKVGRAAFALHTRELATGQVDPEARAQLNAQVQNVAAAISASAAHALVMALDKLLKDSARHAENIGAGLLKLLGK